MIEAALLGGELEPQARQSAGRLKEMI